MVVYYVEVWMDFVVEFCLDLVEVYWYLLVVFDLVVCDVGDDFFVCWFDYEIVVFVVFKV